MKTACAKWKDDLLEAVLMGTVAGELEDHLNACARCTEALAALRARRERMDTLLPLLARGAEPSPEFRARVLVNVQSHCEQERVRPWRAWILAGVSAAIVAAASVSLWHRGGEPQSRDATLTAAQRLADWRAPSDVLLETPEKQFLRATPRLGQSHVKIPITVDKEN